ncbi:unnamed protein product, partial [Closterium sp. Naga37s-1]
RSRILLLGMARTRVSSSKAGIPILTAFQPAAAANHNSRAALLSTGIITSMLGLAAERRRAPFQLTVKGRRWLCSMCHVLAMRSPTRDCSTQPDRQPRAEQQQQQRCCSSHKPAHHPSQLITQARSSPKPAHHASQVITQA